MTARTRFLWALAAALAAALAWPSAVPTLRRIARTRPAPDSSRRIPSLSGAGTPPASGPAPIYLPDSVPRQPPQGWARALVEASHIDERAQRDVRFGALLQAWARDDFDSAYRYALGLPAGPDRDRNILALIAFKAETAPGTAFALLSAEPASTDWAPAYSALFCAWEASDRTAALKAFEALSAGPAKDNAAGALAGSWAARDPNAALSWALAQSDPRTRTVAITSALTLLASTDPLRASQVALSTLTGSALDQVLGPALATIAASDLQGAASLVSMLPNGELQTASAAEIGRRLAASDPQGALAWAQSLSGQDARAAARATALSVWSRSDPRALETYAARTGGADLLLASGRALAVSSPEDALALVQACQGCPSSTALTAAVASTWAQAEPAKAARWVLGLPADSAQAALPFVVSDWLQSDPVGAAAFVSSLAPAAQELTSGQVAGRMAAADAVAAVRWSESLPDDEARLRATSTVAQVWGQTMPRAAATWALNLAAGSERDQALAAVACDCAGHDPQEAATLAAAISDPGVRQRASLFVVR